jgi:hypothetical protein
MKAPTRRGFLRLVEELLVSDQRTYERLHLASSIG